MHGIEAAVTAQVATANDPVSTDEFDIVTVIPEMLIAFIVKYFTDKHKNAKIYIFDINDFVSSDTEIVI